MTAQTTPKRQAAPKRKYLVGVQGLRTVAALLVVVYHIWFRRVSGGVDVFFVVAGFFSIASLLRLFSTTETPLGVLRATGNYMLRTLRRVAPSAALVVVATALAGLLFMPNLFWADNIEAGFASITFSENWHLIEHGTDYLAQDTAASAFQQFWALAVNMQYYVLAALTFGFVAWVAKRRWREASLARLFVVPALLVFVVSLFYSVHLTQVDQPKAYFDTFTRLWEFMAGALLYLLLSRTGRRTIGSAQLKVLGWVSLIGIITLGAVADLGSLLPGYWAAAPVAAASGIIVSSWGDAEPTVLRWKPVLAIADSSFSIYLWHWPLLVFYRQRVGENVSLAGGLAIIVVSVLLAHLTTKFVENPVRSSKTLARSATATLAVIAAFIGVALGVLTLWGDQSAKALQAAVSDARDREETLTPQSGIHPDPSYPKSGFHLGFKPGCIAAAKSPEVQKCRWTHGEKEKTVVVVGGSRTAQWLDAILYESDNLDAEIFAVTKSACPFGDTEGFGYTPTEVCIEWNKAAMDTLLEDPPDLVITNGTRWIDGVNIIPDGYSTAIEKLLDAGIKVVAIEDNPLIPYNVPECVVAKGEENCWEQADKYYSQNDALDPIDDPNFRFVSMADLYCPDGICPSVDDHVLVYQDSHHLTTLWTLVHRERVIEAVQDLLG